MLWKFFAILHYLTALFSSFGQGAVHLLSVTLKQGTARSPLGFEASIDKNEPELLQAH